MVYLIVYDLNKPGTDYEGLYEVIKSFEAWAHCLDSTWAVETSLSADQIYNKVHAKMDKNDCLLITEMGTSVWNLKTEVSSWLTERLKRGL